MKVVGHGHVRVFMTVGFAARKSMNPRWVDCEKLGTPTGLTAALIAPVAASYNKELSSGHMMSQPLTILTYFNIF